MRAYLALEDGTIYEGEGFGAAGRQPGEVVFNTSMTGYQEVLTDPSYCGQIVTMTYPLIGNYGFNEQDLEAMRPFVRGFVARQVCDRPSNWRSRGRLSDYLADNGVVGIQGIDTRALTRKLRNHGTMRGVIAAGDFDPQELAAQAASAPEISGQSLVPEVTCQESVELAGPGPRVVLVDYGAKRSIAHYLNARGCHVVILPAFSTADEVLARQPDGVMLSNGPGDPKDVPYAIQAVRGLLGNVPVFGICLGHQILGLALGADTYKLKFGHRGGNHPVQDKKTGRVYITAQNHGFAIDAASLPAEAEVSHVNLNDGTVEGLRHRLLPAFSVQYHPEAAPGPTDSAYLFEQFLDMVHDYAVRKGA